MSSQPDELGGSARQNSPSQNSAFPGRDSSAAKSPISSPRQSPDVPPRGPSTQRSTSVPSRIPYPSSDAKSPTLYPHRHPADIRDSEAKTPSLYPHGLSTDYTSASSRPSPPISASTRGSGHYRSTSVPSSGFVPFQPPPHSSERVGRASTGSEPPKSGPVSSPRVIRKSSQSRASAESDFFKPFTDVKADPSLSSSPGETGGRKTIRLKLSRSTVGSTDAPSSAQVSPNGSGSPRQPPSPSQNGHSGSRRSDGSGSRRSAGSGRKEEEPNTRVVYINNPERTNEKVEMANNRVRTSKYTLLSFIPRNLFEQFHRYAYIYFLVIVILNQIPQLAVFGRTASIFPLAFVLIVTALKDAYEDLGRHRADRVENNRTSLVLQDGHYKPKKWKDIRVGEMVKIHANETVPCDLVLLGTSDPTGVAYVETLNLDGESNLKSRYATQETAVKHPELGPISGTLICEVPNRNIYEFSAYMDLEGIHLPLGPKNIILRGCEIKNTSWVVGVVVYAGQETKAMLNSSGTQSKRSRLEHNMNRETLWLGTFLLVLCSVGGIGMLQWVARHSDELDSIPYYKERTADGHKYRYYGVLGEGVIGFLGCVIVFQVMIPISLYISMELVRLGQAYFMTSDKELYHEASNTRFQCRALNINEDLGQIKYVFSDKTGTLTENKMEFFSASIHGVDYSDTKVAVDSGGGIDGPPEAINVIEVLAKQPWKPKVGSKVDPKLVRVLQHPFNAEERRAVHDYLLVLAACNTVVPTMVSVSATTGQLEMQAASSGVEDGLMEGGLMEYQGESPDEQALVTAAASYGYTLLERTSTDIVINILGEMQRFEVMGTHEFDSIRKRMSVVIRCPDGTIKLLMKGADSAVLNIVGSSDSQEVAAQKRQAEISLATLGHLDRYAREGLRTLVIASKDLNPKEVAKWEEQYKLASGALADRAGMLREAAEMVERDLTLLGATGIEDKLQEGVPETIALLREADMQVWVLTGDKQETAISIAFSCLLITRDMQQIIINETTVEGCREALANARSLYGIGQSSKKKQFLWRQKKTIDNVSNGGSPAQSDPDAGLPSGHLDVTGLQLALIIDGNSLVHGLSEDLEQELFDVAIACKVVVCCRVAPLQKAGIVSLVKRRAKEITLAIGDGANDVSMIQMAHVGIGISGQEGRQAVMASDFAMGQFRFLKRVLLVHGHWNFFRLGYMVLYNFYRNAVLVFCLFWYILYTLFSPQTAFSDWNLVLYSVIYSAVPTIVVGILDKDVSEKTLLRYPALYTAGLKGVSYSQPLFWAFMADTIWQSLVVFYVAFFTYHHSDVDIYGLGTLWILGIVLLVNLHLAMDIQRWTWIHHVAIWGSILATWLAVLVMDSISSIDGLLPQYWELQHMVGKWSFWFDLLLILVLALLPRFIVKVFWQQFFPSDVQIAREAEIMGVNGNRLEQAVELNEVSHAEEST